ncbi:MAG TPA: hypothetical protein VHP83_17595 [Aggregatilineaceae bacterium]|nr:hypothetical protein [Aggregatilineaceae bacterium]
MGDSRVRRPAHVARLLVVLVLAYVWVIALGSQAVALQHAKPLIRHAKSAPQRQSDWRELLFIPDSRFPWQHVLLSAACGKGSGDRGQPPAAHFLPYSD